MTLAKPRYLVGIDLGTTHTVVAYSAISDDVSDANIELFAIDQLVRPGEISALPLLPSVRYQASTEELTEADIQLPWPDPGDTGGTPILGELARKLGARSSGRLVVSAKSWLSHPTADRSANILPWGAPDTIRKISPVAASASYLRHVHHAWNHHHSDAPLSDQELVVTVPASFDEAARALTLDAARQAGLPRLRLLEEPQAVCYDWLWQQRGQLTSSLNNVRLLLVVDLGGGTLDLTLIRVDPDPGEPRLTRIAVGNHLMLGGDNIDLALAHRAEQQLQGDGQRLGTADLSQLVDQCRVAKERLLSPNAPEIARVTLLGSGSRLIGGSRSVELSRTEVHQQVLDGFFPLVSFDEKPVGKRSGVLELGLPYAADPAITRHLAAFLAEHRHAAREVMGMADGIAVPDALLLNGGVFQSPLVVDRLCSQIAQWRGSPPVVLHNQRPDQAVAFGAVASGLARKGKHVQRIGGGAARSYFVRIEADSETDNARGVCLLPRGTEEGTEIVLSDREFALTTGAPVRFDLLMATDDFRPLAGAIVDIDRDNFQALPPLVVILNRDESTDAISRTVRLAAALSDVGTLDMHCVATDDPDQRWHIEFQVRGAQTAKMEGTSLLHPRLTEAVEQIRQVFGKKAKGADPKAVKGVRHALEKILGPRDEWETPLLRELFGVLLEGVAYRRRSADHERLWFNLAGFCLRPGFGYPLDDWRADQMFSLYSAGIQYVNESQNWAEWWTLWRRIAGGLHQSAQKQLFDDLSAFINPDTVKRGNLATLLKKRSYEDMLRLVSVLENIPAQDKMQLGGWLLKRLEKPAEPAVAWWALGRIGGRVPFHGSPHNVVPISLAETWLNAALQRDFRKEAHAAFASVMLARMSGDRERDVDDALRKQVIDKLRIGKAPESWLAMVAEYHELSEADEVRLFGESLPPGLRLIG